METKKAILKRRSCRRFTDKPVEKELLEELLQAGIWSPTAGNIQPWAFICITDPKSIKNIRIVSPGMLGNPNAIICICSNRKKAFKKAGDSGKTLALMDCAMASQNIMLRAFDLGLGTCVIRSFNQRAVRELLAAPEHIHPELLITIGYPAQIPPPPKRSEEVIFWEQFTEIQEEKSE